VEAVESVRVDGGLEIVTSGSYWFVSAFAVSGRFRFRLNETRTDECLPSTSSRNAWGGLVSASSWDTGVIHQGWKMRKSIPKAIVAAVFAIAAAVAAQSAVAQTAPTFRDVRVDVSPLRANAGDPTAAWVQRELSIGLAQALEGRMARNGATLIVRIDYLTLGPNTGEMLHAAASLDNINGVAIIGSAQTPVRATTSFYTSPIDQTMIEQSNHARVSQLTQALAYWIARGAFF
jgi:hypothetical protein